MLHVINWFTDETRGVILFWIELEFRGTELLWWKSLLIKRTTSFYVPVHKMKLRLTDERESWKPNYALQDLITGERMFWIEIKLKMEIGEWFSE
jgi:hypothetical protein